MIHDMIEEPEDSDNDERNDNENFSDNVSILNKILKINSN